MPSEDLRFREKSTAAAVETDLQRFLERLAQQPHSRPRRVYTHQQPYVDYRGSVVAKFLALRNLQDLDPTLRAYFVIIDTDRAASDKLGLRLYWPEGNQSKPIRLAPPGCEAMESRFIRMDPTRFKAAVNTLLSRVQQMPNARKGPLARWAAMRECWEIRETLADQLLPLARFLFHRTLRFEPEMLLVSKLMANFTDRIGQLLIERSAVIARWNQSVAEISRSGLDPCVSPLPDNWLPLFYTDPQSLQRIRMRFREIQGAPFAVVEAGPNREEQRFFLGNRPNPLAGLPCLSALSPDVSVPLLLNHMFDGMVVGRSSARYMVVFQDVLQDILGEKPIPLFLPPRLDVLADAGDSLLYAYLTGWSAES